MRSHEYRTDKNSTGGMCVTIANSQIMAMEIICSSTSGITPSFNYSLYVNMIINTFQLNPV